ncbi:MAG: 50S ribosome-binding GTPase [Candidatus Methanomethyliaceae archaeon]|nr:50S ribosome-binding GTPase [Candidatus Methanomethyliaceae archaeon]
MQQPFERMPTVLTAEEIINKAFLASTRIEIELQGKPPAIIKAKKREGARIREVEKITAAYLESLVKSVPTIDNIHPFYREMLEILVGEAAAKAALGRLSRAARIIHEAGRAAHFQLRDARNPGAAARARRALFGRTSSIIRKADDDLTLISTLREKMKDLPTADPSVPTVVFAGYPGVGKSTIVKAVSSAKPEIRSYPFTTREIIIGHVAVGNTRIQMVDTPGLLDRPLVERSKTELLAITALGHLSNVIAFIVDVSEANGFSLASQKHLCDDVRAAFSGNEILTFFNKIDLANPYQVSEAEALFGSCDRLSAVKGEGLDIMLKKVEEALRRAQIKNSPSV